MTQRWKFRKWCWKSGKRDSHYKVVSRIILLRAWFSGVGKVSGETVTIKLSLESYSVEFDSCWTWRGLWSRVSLLVSVLSLWMLNSDSGTVNYWNGASIRTPGWRFLLEKVQYSATRSTSKLDLNDGQRNMMDRYICITIYLVIDTSWSLSHTYLLSIKHFL